MAFKNRAERSAAVRSVAERLGKSERTIVRLGLCDGPLESVKIRMEKAEKASKWREKCKKYAEMVVNGEISHEKAANILEISRRQLTRYIQKVPNVQ